MVSSLSSSSASLPPVTAVQPSLVLHADSPSARSGRVADRFCVPQWDEVPAGESTMSSIQRGKITGAQPYIFQHQENRCYCIRPYNGVYKRNPSTDSIEERYRTGTLRSSETGVHVFDATDLITKKKVTLKCNFAEVDPQYSSSYGRIENESSVLKKLEKNPFTPAIIDSFYANDQQRVLVLERFKKESFLDSRFKSRPIEWGHIISIAFQLVNALHYFEQKKVVHCNLSLEKLSLDPCMQLKVTDFERGQMYTCLPQDELEMDAYKAPETCLKLVSSNAVDMWAVGSIIAQLVTGKPLLPTGPGINPIRAIAKLRGLPPARWLDKSSVRSLAFVKEEDGAYSLVDDDGKLHRPKDRLVEHLTEKVMSRWTKEPFPSERALLIDLIDRMTSYEKRINPWKAIHHPLFKNYVYWEVSKRGPTLITRLSIQHLVSKPTCLEVDLTRYPTSRWLLPTQTESSQDYHCVFYNGEKIIQKNKLRLNSRAIIEIRSNKKNEDKFDVVPLDYGEDPDPTPTSTGSGNFASSSSSSGMSAADSSRSLGLDTLAQAAASSSSSGSRPPMATPSIQATPTRTESGVSTSSSRGASPPISLGKRSSASLQTTLSRDLPRSNDQKRLKQMQRCVSGLI